MKQMKNDQTYKLANWETVNSIAGSKKLIHSIMKDSHIGKQVLK